MASASERSTRSTLRREPAVAVVVVRGWGLGWVAAVQRQLPLFRWWGDRTSRRHRVVTPSGGPWPRRRGYRRPRGRRTVHRPDLTAGW
jgi:hypothetical protein